jgi:hypothetical protein
MIAAGTIRVVAGDPNLITVTGLPFTPRRIIFRSATPSANPPTNISHGLWSADREDSEDFPQQSCMGMYMDAANSYTHAEPDTICYILNQGVPQRRLRVSLIQVTSNAFSVQPSINELTLDAYMHWIATP